MKKYLLVLLLLAGCHHKNGDESELMTLHTVDRNGFSETISSKDRLNLHRKNDFLSPQPFQRVVRIFSRDQEGKTPSIMTSYHENGQLWQYLEIANGRAFGVYREWYENGQPRLETYVVEGLGDLSESAQEGWIFHGTTQAFDKTGNLLASFEYDKGLLHGQGIKYHPNGCIGQTIQYAHGEIHGALITYDDVGNQISEMTYCRGKREGEFVFKGTQVVPCYEEEYENGFLMKGLYYDFEGDEVASIQNGFGMKPYYQNGILLQLQEYQAGKPEGEVKSFSEKGLLTAKYYLHEWKKHGLETLYHKESDVPMIEMMWYEDEIHGMVKTFYPDRTLESQKEMFHNEKHGPSIAWYRDGNLMLMEEYENDTLVKGTYYKKGEKLPISSIENGSGVATLFDLDGIFLKRITYHEGSVCE